MNIYIYIVIPLCVNEIVDNPFLMKVIFYIFCLQTAGEQNEIKKKKKVDTIFAYIFRVDYEKYND